MSNVAPLSETRYKEKDKIKNKHLAVFKSITSWLLSMSSTTVLSCTNKIKMGLPWKLDFDLNQCRRLLQVSGKMTLAGVRTIWGKKPKNQKTKISTLGGICWKATQRFFASFAPTTDSLSCFDFVTRPLFSRTKGALSSNCLLLNFLDIISVL